MRKKHATVILACLIVSVLSGCCLSHEWQEATCTAPRTCAKCGETEGEPLGHEWTEATCTAPRTCARCGETEGEPLGHTWIEATYHEPETCSVCGETNGTVKKSFFERNGLKVNDKLKSVTLDSVVVNNYNRPTRIETCPTTITFKSHFVSPSSRPNYKTIKLVLTGRLLVPSFAGGGESPLGGICDYYTGYSFESRDSEDDELVELYDSVTVDGTKYTLYYSMNVEYTAVMKWSKSEKSYYTEYVVTYVIDMPNDYDGLVFVITAVDDFEVDTSLSSGYIDPKDKSYYFWLGRD